MTLDHEGRPREPTCTDLEIPCELTRKIFAGLRTPSEGNTVVSPSVTKNTTRPASPCARPQAPGDTCDRFLASFVFKLAFENQVFMTGSETKIVNLYCLQICVRSWVPENSQHRDNLALVVKRVGYDMQQDKSGTPGFAAPVHGTLGQGRVELLFREIADVDPCRLSYSFFGDEQIRHCWAVLFVPTVKRFVLQVMDPAFLAGQNMHKLLPNAGMAES
jgi:hypothetical protein